MQLMGQSPVDMNGSQLEPQIGAVCCNDLCIRNLQQASTIPTAFHVPFSSLATPGSAVAPMPALVGPGDHRRLIAPQWSIARLRSHVQCRSQRVRPIEKRPEALHFPRPQSAIGFAS